MIRVVCMVFSFPSNKFIHSYRRLMELWEIGTSFDSHSVTTLINVVSLASLLNQQICFTNCSNTTEWLYGMAMV